MPPQRGDLIIRDRNDRFLVHQVGRREPLAPACDSLTQALKFALESKPGTTIWRENADHRGRTLGPPIQIHPPPR